MSTAVHECSVCGATFELKFAYQLHRTADAVLYFCGQGCHERHLFAAQQKTCHVCGGRFELQYAFQQSVVDGEMRYFCATRCRDRGLEEAGRRRRRMRRIAVLNQKGGTGKTTTSVNLAAGFADAGYRTLLLDLDAQGNVAVSLGLSAKRSLYHVLCEDADPTNCIINVAPNLDALISTTALAQAEVKLVNMREREKVLRDRLQSITDYDFAVLDCAPSLSVLNQNALVYADQILIPVSCDYLSLVGVKQILRTLRRVNELLLHPVSILVVVPTFYDMRTRISVDSVNTLRAYFKSRVLHPIRVNTRLKEAPSHKKTIFEYAPDSHGADDYRALVARIIEICAEDAAGEPTSRQIKEAALERSGA